MGQRGIDVKSLLSDLHLFFRNVVFEGSHIVEAVSQFNQDDSNILHHRQNHLAEIFCLVLFRGS